MGKLTKLFIGCTAIGIAAATAYYFMERNAESEIPAADIDEEAPEVEAKTEEKENFINKATRTYTTVVSFIADSAEKVMDYLDRDEEDEFDPEEEPEEETAEEALEAAEEVKEAAEDAAGAAKAAAEEAAEAVEDKAADTKEAVEEAAAEAIDARLGNGHDGALPKLRVNPEGAAADLLRRIRYTACITCKAVSKRFSACRKGRQILFCKQFTGSRLEDLNARGIILNSLLQL